MYLPRQLISHLYLQLLRSHHPLSPPVLLLVALEPDALCACRILTALLKRDYIPHKIQPVAGYGDLSRAGEELVRPMQTTNGGTGGVVICLGVGGLVDLAETLSLHNTEEGGDDFGGVEIWVFDSRRPWNLANIFGGQPSVDSAMAEMDGNARRRGRGVDNGCITPAYTSKHGGIIVFDDGDIEEELGKEREAYYALLEMPEVDDDDDYASEDGMDDDDPQPGKKRKSWSGREDEDGSDEDDEPPHQRVRSNSGSSLVSSPTRSRKSSGSPTPKQPSARALKRRLIGIKRDQEGVLHSYYSNGTSYAEPISSLIYSLASELGREDNDLLWLGIVGVASLELSGRTMTGVGISNTSESGGSAGWGGQRGEHIRQILRDEVHRLNPPDPLERDRDIRGEINGIIPTTARSPTDTSIRISPEPRFLLVRHWSLYESMLHSPFLAPKLHVWTEYGRKRLHKFLAKMGISLTQCHQFYTHMDMELKRGLRGRLLQYAPMYGLDGLVPNEASAGSASSREGWGFVRCWGWKACLSATDVGVLLGAILEVGPHKASVPWDARRAPRTETANEVGSAESDMTSLLPRFWSAYDALSLTSESPTLLMEALPLAQHLHRAILRTGSSLLSKHQIRHLKTFRIAVVKDGPDVKLFSNAGALTKLALWLAEAIRVQEREKDTYKMGRKRAAGTPLVLAGFDEERDLYVVVGTGGGGGVVDHAALLRRKEERVKKKAAREKKQKERAERRAKRAAERAQRDEEDEEEDSDESESSSESESEDEEDQSGKRHLLRNRFGIAFQEVVHDTKARVRIDSFEHCVVEVRKDDLGNFLETLSLREVVG
ncbi:hypothetical protein N7495_002169 [Penicillium taxi]|uniref:uncharacterized protein n=1 Tax=Penicillium taxi TaxID=168475 RepID=UPI002544D683|nr:uncharacterized protein N7495_002169 [Penicillium taxi]KAJ5901641.1 hypothetical protein N7495_002169 [Penicillium taxi]